MGRRVVVVSMATVHTQSFVAVRKESSVSIDVTRVTTQTSNFTLTVFLLHDVCPHCTLRPLLRDVPRRILNTFFFVISEMLSVKIQRYGFSSIKG